MTPYRKIGFVGLGVMGEPICRHLVTQSGLPVTAFDRNDAPLQRLRSNGVQAADSIARTAQAADVLFVALPSGEGVAEVVRAKDGLLETLGAGSTLVDLGTSPVALTRALAAECAAREITFVDAPVARTRAAAEAGTLAVMVGADQAAFRAVRPLLATFATDITHCGPVGCGQVVKILNNMVLFETVVALSEACAIARRAGVTPALLLDALTKGSADSFALRHHGLKAILPGAFPTRAFSAAYARKDLAYALSLAEQTGVAARGAEVADRWLGAAVAAGCGDRYFPVISLLIDLEEVEKGSRRKGVGPFPSHPGSLLDPSS